MDLQRLTRLDYWRSFIKFNIVGLSGVVVNEGVLVALTFAGVFYLYSSAVAIELSILSNFVLHDLWTFRDRRHGHALARLLKFNGLMVIGLAVNLAILFLGTDYLGINYAVSNLVGIAGAFLVRYWLSVKYAWIRKEEKSVEPPGNGLPVEPLSPPSGTMAFRPGQTPTTLVRSPSLPRARPSLP